MSAPRFKYSVICEPDFIDGFYSIYIRDGDNNHLVKKIRIEDLKNKSFNDYLWESLRKGFEKLIEREDMSIS